MITIEEFIKARLAEDEEIAKAAAGGSAARWVADEDEVYAVFGSLTDPDRCEDHAPGRPNVCDDNRVASSDDCSDQWLDERARHIARHDPPRVLRQVERDRKVIARHRMRNVIGGPVCDGCGARNGERLWPCAEVRDLSAVWADHPDHGQWSA